jgi:hypothetical protein
MRLILKVAIPLCIAVANYDHKALADFGPAEVGGKNNETRTFEAWCGEKGNTCKVSFDEDGLLINDRNKVLYSAVKYFHYGANKGKCNAYGFWCVGRGFSFDIIYTKKDGGEGVGKIIFADERIAIRFMHNLKTATGDKPWASDPRCSEGQVFHEGICLSPAKTAEIRTREKESKNASEAVKEHGRAIGAGLAVQGALQKEGLESAGKSIGDGLGNIRVEQNTELIVVPR